MATSQTDRKRSPSQDRRETPGPLPFLFHPRVVGRYRNSSADQGHYRDSFNDFGKTAAAMVANDHKPPWKDIASTNNKYWKRALAADALICTCARRSAQFDAYLTNPKEISVSLDPKRMPPYSEFQIHKLLTAAALFPMTGCNGSSDLGRIWAVKDSENKIDEEAYPFDLEGSDNISNYARSRKIKLFADIPEGICCTGTSWQASAWLALEAVDRSDDDATKLRLALASDLIATGEVQVRGGYIKGVELGNKPDLAGNRTWIIPRENHEQFAKIIDKREIELNYLIPTTVDHALALLSGRFFTWHSEEELPKKVSHLNVFVLDLGRGVPPWIKACQVEKELRIWVAGKSENNTLRKQFPKAIITQLQDNAKFDIEISRYFQELSLTENILVDLTGSSWSFQVAFLLEMQANPNSKIQSIYYDTTYDRTTKFWFEHGTPQICFINEVKTTEPENSPDITHGDVKGNYLKPYKDLTPIPGFVTKEEE